MRQVAVPDASPVKSPQRTATGTKRLVTKSARLGAALSLAEEKGLLKGKRTLVLRGRMPEKLVAEAKRKTGITSDSKLLETALASIVVADDYADWLLAQRGSIDPSIDLEF